MSRSVLRPMGIGEILDAAFGLYRRHFVDLVKLGALVIVPQMVLSLVDMGVAFVAQFILPLVLTVALMKRASGYILEEDTTYGQCLKLGLRKWFPVFAAQFLVSMVTTLGYLLFIVPGVLLTAVWFAWMPVMVLEDDWGFPSRSAELAKGAWVKILVVKLVSFVILFGPGAVLGVAGGAFDTSAAPQTFGEALPDLWVMLAGLAIALLTTPFKVLVDVMLYYERRVAVEGLDVELATRDLDAAAPDA